MVKENDMILLIRYMKHVNSTVYKVKPAGTLIFHSNMKITS